MIELSPDTVRLIGIVIPIKDRSRIKQRLVLEVAENIPCYENSNPKAMERIRFSVIRLLSENQMLEDDIFKLAYIDWRDLFMNANHGENIYEHKKWATEIFNNPKNRY